jgi:hypothetical protein
MEKHSNCHPKRIQSLGRAAEILASVDVAMIHSQPKASSLDNPDIDSSAECRCKPRLLFVAGKIDGRTE